MSGLGCWDLRIEERDLLKIWVFWEYSEYWKGVIGYIEDIESLVVEEWKTKWTRQWTMNSNGMT